MSNEDFKKYCGNCSNLMRISLLGKETLCCGGNVDYPSKCSLAKKQYQIKVKDNIYTIPKKNIKLFALSEALNMGITHGNIHDEKTAIDFLISIGIEVSEA